MDDEVEQRQLDDEETIRYTLHSILIEERTEVWWEVWWEV
jgi:hypothetical protein